MRPVQKAFTLVEILVVLVIFFIVAVPLYVNVTAIRSRQHLEEAAEQLFASLKSAHVYAREIKNNAGWGVDFLNEKTYRVVYGKSLTDPALAIEKSYSLNPEIRILDYGSKDTWFEKGTGMTTAQTEIKLVNKKNQVIPIILYTSGLVEKGAMQ